MLLLFRIMLFLVFHFGYTNAALVEGENLTIEQLLYVLMLPSANDAAIVLAEHIAGSVESFASFLA